MPTIPLLAPETHEGPVLGVTLGGGNEDLEFKVSVMDEEPGGGSSRPTIGQLWPRLG